MQAATRLAGPVVLAIGGDGGLSSFPSGPLPGWLSSWCGAGLSRGGKPGGRARTKPPSSHLASEITWHHLGHILTSGSTSLSRAHPSEGGCEAPHFEGGPVSEGAGIVNNRRGPLCSFHRRDCSCTVTPHYGVLSHWWDVPQCSALLDFTATGPYWSDVQT